MRGIHWVVFVHTGSALLTTLLLGSILWDRRKHAPLHTLVAAMTAILSLQIMLGMVALWVHGRPVAVGFVHAMLSPLLVAGLVSIAIRDRTSPATIPAYNQPGELTCALFGVVGLLIALAIVSVLVKKQMSALTTAGPAGLASVPAGATPATKPRIQNQIKQSVESTMQQARPMPEDK